MEKWEYLTQAVQVADLPKLGQEGWRMISVDDGIMFLMRPLADPEPMDPEPEPELIAPPEPVVPAFVEPPVFTPPNRRHSPPTP